MPDIDDSSTVSEAAVEAVTTRNAWTTRRTAVLIAGVGIAAATATWWAIAQNSDEVVRHVELAPVVTDSGLWVGGITDYTTDGSPIEVPFASTGTAVTAHEKALVMCWNDEGVVDDADGIALDPVTLAQECVATTVDILAGDAQERGSDMVVVFSVDDGYGAAISEAFADLGRPLNPIVDSQTEYFTYADLASAVEDLELSSAH